MTEEKSHLSIVSLGDSTRLLGYEVEDYSGSQYRFRDDPIEENYDIGALAVQVMGGIAVVGAMTLATGGAAAAFGFGTEAVMGATAIGGTSYVAGMAVADAIQGRVSGMEEYTKAALAGSVISALTGATNQMLPEGMSVLGHVGIDFLSGSAESAVGQMMMEGEIDRKSVFRDGLLAAVVGEVSRKIGGGVLDEVGSGEGGPNAFMFNNWDDMKDTYKGTITQFVKENKPKYSPDIKKWFDNGGSIEIQNIDGKQIWTYISATGNSVPYIEGYIKFPDEYLNPTIKSIDIGEFTGNRSKDIDIMMAILEEDYGITEIPDGYIAHHDIENGILQLVDENIHKEFTHIGGHSIYK